MTREEFEEWLEERRDEALDNMQQSDTTAQKWLARLHAALKVVADEEDAEESEPEENDLFEDESEDSGEDPIDMDEDA